MSLINRLVDQFRMSQRGLADYKARHFPMGTPVMVDCPRYTGPGVVDGDSGCPPDKVPVTLGNGNVWWYPIEALTLAPAAGTLSPCPTSPTSAAG